MSGMSSVSGPSWSTSSLNDFSHMNFEECAKSIHKMIRVSLRGYARSIELFRELEDAESEEATRAKAKSFRSVVPMIMRIGSAALSGLNLGLSLCPQATMHSYEWLASKCPIFDANIFDGFIKPGTGLDLAECSKFISKKFSNGEGFFKTALEITGNYEQADRAELDALIQKARELGDRRSREANDRRSESDELLQALQQMNREIAEAIKSVSRS